MPSNVDLYVVFDTNIWYSELGLTTKDAAAVRFFLLRKNATVAIPEVVSLELKARLGEKLKSAKRDTERSHRELVSIFGSWPEMPLPSNEQIEEAIHSCLTNIDVPHIHIPFSFESARSSLTKVVNKISPAKHREEFRDGVIWADCVALLEEAEVYLVTDDSDFYQSKNDRNDREIARDLLPETSAHGNAITLFRSLDQLLEEVRSDITIDRDMVLRSVFEAETKAIDENVLSGGFQFSGWPEVNVTPYITEKANELNFRFSIRQPCQDATPRERRADDLRFSGEGFFDTTTNTIDRDRLHVSNMGFSYRDADGNAWHTGSVRVRASLTGGAKQHAHTVRIEVEPSRDR